MKNPFSLILLCCVLMFANSCQQSKSNKPAAVTKPQYQPVNQIQAINVPSTYKYKPLKLTGNEVPYKDLKFEKDAKGKKVAKHNGALFTGATVYKLTDGKIFIYQNYKDGIKHGSYRQQLNGQDDNGNPDNTFEVGERLNGNLHGTQLTYYDGPGGSLKKASFYNNSLMNGQWSSYYRSGAQWTRRDFNNGQLNGKVLVWGEDGVLGKEYTYRNGAMIEKLNHFENN